ncbi:enoyl-CoA hydratase/isomerase family protein [Winogradskyella eckloniae]|uniref:enoyl-CoA hydratase-related protein n=1 Tax=Winogradskyella eckloniae TaxID=1089306 RepID=UPI001563F965|nr:enoyl-CoA hydratase-related protein [Winogradskyella eckloniae]NRD19413.1 enoyl-CoA hydratase/isomerase family protein [Winogradskyella eckloniae]
MSKSILLKVENKIAYITLNRPEVFNSINREMAFLFQDTLDACEINSEIRAIVITGAGKAFGAGQDLKEVTDPDLNPGFKKILDEHYNPIITKIRAIKKPIIAAVNGVAAGAAANIALACDIVVAHEKVNFIQAFSLIGLIPDSAGTYFLPRLIGFQKAQALAMLGDKISAGEAEKMGMIYKMIPLESFEEDVNKLALKLANMPTLALGKIKEAFNASLTNTLEQQLALESKLQIEAASTNDYAEGVAAFIEKRKPNFKGN